jgi:predicted MPP superfamily phosphohydrolase
MTFALFAAACVGHLALMVTSHNWFYGLRLPRWASDIVHLVHGILVLVLPAVCLVGWGSDLHRLFEPTALHGPAAALAVYLWLCVLTAVVGLPVDAFIRWRRREPGTALRSEVVNVSRHLGRRPLGDGHHGFLGRLPGTEIFHIEYLEKTLHPPRLPAALDGLTILHLSDLHFHGTPDRDYYRVILDRCAAWMPDIVAITGDVADSPIHHRWILPLLGRLRWRIGAFAILGNHDHRYDVPIIRRRLRKLGMEVLANTWVQTSVRGEPMSVIGHEGPWLMPAPDLSNCPIGPFRLCLSHTPDNILWGQQHGVDLMLAGHVHGGQIRFPVFGSMLVPSRFGRRYDCGTFAVGETLLHVSRGVSGEHPVRYNCLPEVTLLTLRK